MAMMEDKNGFSGIFCCPLSGQSLRPATEIELERLRARQASGVLVNRMGREVTVDLAAGWVSDRAKVFFPEVDSIRWMVVEEAIELEG